MKNHHRQIVLLLGSNIDPEYNLPRAIQLLRNRIQIERVSSVWETPAVGSEGPCFLNAAILLESILSPQVMKKILLRPLEAYLGRVRTDDKYAPRTIDLDVVVWGSRTWDQDIWRHAHAAVPVAELVPGLRCEPYQQPLAQIAQKLQNETEIVFRADISWQVRSPRKFIFPQLARNTGFPIHIE